MFMRRNVYKHRDALPKLTYIINILYEKFQFWTGLYIKFVFNLWENFIASAQTSTFSHFQEITRKEVCPRTW